jgi:hypothetical protein
MTDQRERADAALLEAVAALAREEAARGPDAAALAELEALAAGTLPPDAHARLVADQPNATRALFEPLSADFQARAADAALGGMGLAPAQAPSAPVPIAHARPRDRSSLDMMVSLATARKRLWWAVVPATAAAALALWVMRPPEQARLAEYTLQVQGGEAVARADTPENTATVPTVGPGSRLALVLRPSRPSTTPLVARAWLARDGVLRPWAVEPEVSEAGAVRIAGTWETLGLGALEPGEWEALLVVATPDHVPDDTEVAATLKEPPPVDAPWRLQRGRFIVNGAH